MQVYNSRANTVMQKVPTLRDVGSLSAECGWRPYEHTRYVVYIRESRQHMYRINHRYTSEYEKNDYKVYNAEMDIMKIFWDYNNNYYTRKHNVVSDLSVTLKGTQPH